MFYYYFDRYYWILIVPAMLFAMWAQTKVNSTYNRYNRVYSARGMSAAQVCRQILDENGLFHIRVEHVSGKLTDHYDPKAGVIRLSDSVYASSSVAAIGVAAHEAGHAVVIHELETQDPVHQIPIIPHLKAGLLRQGLVEQLPGQGQPCSGHAGAQVDG